LARTVTAFFHARAINTALQGVNIAAIDLIQTILTLILSVRKILLELRGIAAPGLQIMFWKRTSATASTPVRISLLLVALLCTLLPKQGARAQFVWHPAMQPYEHGTTYDFACLSGYGNFCIVAGVANYDDSLPTSVRNIF